MSAGGEPEPPAPWRGSGAGGAGLHLPADTAQQEGPVRSTVHHNPALTPGTGEDGSLNPEAPAGQGERPAPPSNRPHGYPWGRGRHRRTGTTPAIRKPAPPDLRIKS